MLTDNDKKSIIGSEADRIIADKISDKITQIVIDKETKLRINKREKAEAKKERFERISEFFEDVFCDSDFIDFNKIMAICSEISDNYVGTINPETVDIKCVLGLLNKKSFLAEEPKEIRMKRIAGCIYAYLDKRGGKFYNNGSDLLLVYMKKVYYLDKKDVSVRRSFLSFFFDLTGVITGNNDGKVILDTFINIVSIKAIECEMKPPIWVDSENKIIYMSMCNEEREILKITKDGISVVYNGDNGLLVNDMFSKIRPFKFIKDVDIDKISNQARMLFKKSLSCKTDDSDFIMDWIFAFPFAQMVSTRPLMRFEGRSGSGKTTAQKIITTLLYGEQQQKRATNAANYSDGAINPLIALDQVEVVNVDQNLTDFLLMSATGTVNEKRKQGSDTEIISERVNCLVCSSGIEPLRGDLQEINNRTIVIRFAMPEGVYIENDVMQEVKNLRNEMMSMIILKAQKVLKLIDDKMLTTIMQKLPRHSKYRCNEYIALMYLMSNYNNKEKLETISTDFIETILRYSFETEEISISSNHIVTSIQALFTEGRSLNCQTELDRFFEVYGMHFDGHAQAIIDFKLVELFVALSKSSKKNNILFPYNTPAQFIQRFTNEKETLSKCGFEIKSRLKGGGKRYYTLFCTDNIIPDEIEQEDPNDVTSKA